MRGNRVTVSGCVLLGLCLVMGTGCASTGPQPYQPNPPESNGTPTKLRVAVVELEDQSPPNVFHGIGTAFLPGVLYTKAHTIYTPPTMTQFGSCLASELRASGGFAEVTYFPNWGVGPETFDGYDLIVSGNLLKDKRDDYMVTYGLSAFSSIIALLGIPSGFEDREVSLEISVSWRNALNQLLMRKVISFSEPSQWFTVYGGNNGNWQAGESAMVWSHCPTEHLRGPLLEVRKNLLTAIRENSSPVRGVQP